jgi:hypothetical protein
MGNEINTNNLNPINKDRTNTPRPNFLEILRQIVGDVFAGKAADPEGLLKGADLGGLRADPQRLLELARSFADAARLAEQVSRGQVPAQNYDARGLALEKQTKEVLSADPTLQAEALKLNQDLRLKVDQRDQSVTLDKSKPKPEFVPLTKRSTPAATSAEYGQMLDRLASGQNLPTQAEVEKLANAEVERLAKKGVPKENQEAIRSVLLNAYGMATHKGKDQAQFDKAKEGYRQAVENRKMWWTVSPEELRQMQKTYQTQTGEALPGQQKLEEMVQKRKQDSVTQTERRRATPRGTPPRSTPRRPVAPSRQPPVRRTPPPIVYRPLEIETVKTMRPAPTQIVSPSRDLGITDPAMRAKIG